MVESQIQRTAKKLGLTYTNQKSIIRVWAPTQETILIYLYKTYDANEFLEYKMEPDFDGTFEIELEGDFEGYFYTFMINGTEVCDPYSFASSANSKRSAIIDLTKSNPEGFLEHKIPYNDREKAIIAEAHIADISIDETSGVKHRGLFLGASEFGTKYNDVSTSIDHFAELGITHLHLLPVTDYFTVDEEIPLVENKENYNWGYDQELYSNLEGSFSTNPNDPYSRIREFKTLVKNYHEKGISVVLDVVYNHTFKTLDSPFNIIYPNYYYRQNELGEFSNGSGCGNELASEKPMVGEFIIDSLCYLAEEYKIDGFRFDLMALIDMKTLLRAKKKLEKINPNILIYGEPWMALGSTLDSSLQVNIGSQKGKEIAIFNPFFRDNLKGDNDGSSKGYLQGEYSLKSQIEEGIAGSIGFRTSDSPFATPLETINYFNAHDNLIFNDKLIKSNVKEEHIKPLTYMAFSILLTSQGLPFFHSGNEFMRTKKMNHNSYNASSDINGIDWSLKEKNYDLFIKVSKLIKLRKELGIFNLKTRDEILSNLRFIETKNDAVIAYTINKNSNTYLIIHNVSDKEFNLIDSGYSKFEIIWKNDFIKEEVEEINVGEFSTNIYIVKE